MAFSTAHSTARRPLPDWVRSLARYEARGWRPGIIQLITTILPYLAVLALMFATVELGYPYWIVLALTVPASLFLVRTFIIFHDCTHGSFFPSNRANRVVGFITGVLTFTSFEPWRISHLRHHATNGQLDHRGFGDVMTMTLEEYRQASIWKRLGYRLYRNPLVMNVLGSIYTFLIGNRFAGIRQSPAERRSAILTNAGILAMAVGLSLTFGLTTYLLVQLPVIFIAGIMGVWLFYVQHQFQPGYWEHDESWDRVDAAMQGASYYRLPGILRWFTGNIGVHNVHHLRPRIPGYRLYEAYRDVPETHAARPLTLWRSLGAIRCNLWNEAQRRFMSFREAARLIRTRSVQKA